MDLYRSHYSCPLISDRGLVCRRLLCQLNRVGLTMAVANQNPYRTCDLYELPTGKGGRMNILRAFNVGLICPLVRNLRSPRE